MKRTNAQIEIPDEIIMNKILMIRGKKVMIDRDLAALYGTTTKRLNEQVKRNSKRFPSDFMFRLNLIEKDWLIENVSHLSSLKFSTTMPLVFTEHGAVMLASVLNSEKAIKVNIRIVKIFTRLREMLLTHKDILLQLERLEKNVTRHNKEIQYIFNTLKQLIQQPTPPRKRIGY